MKLTPERLADLRATELRLYAVPWVHKVDGKPELRNVVDWVEEFSGTCMAEIPAAGINRSQLASDIAAARNALPELLDAAEALAGLVDAAEPVLRIATDSTNHVEVLSEKELRKVNDLYAALTAARAALGRE